MITLNLFEAEAERLIACLKVAEASYRAHGLDTCARVFIDKIQALAAERSHNTAPWEESMEAKVAHAKFPPEDHRPGHVHLTRPLLDALRTNGAFTTATIRALGVTDLSKGWVDRLVGTPMPKGQYDRAKAGVGVYSKTTLRMRRNGL